MIKYVVLILFLFIMISMQAEAKSLICQQNPLDVRLELSINEDVVRLSVVSPLGYSFLPFLDPMSESQLEQTQYQVDQLRVLTGAFWVEWKAQDCRYQIETPLKQTKLECSKAEKASTDKVDFNTFSISTITDESFSGIWKSLRFRMTVAVNGPWGQDFFFLSIPAYEQFCLSF